MRNAEYEERLEEIAALMQVAGANTFRVRAFERAARAIHGLGHEVDALLDAGEIMSVEGIGASIAKDLQQIRERGTCDALDALRAQFPPGLRDLLSLQGLGPKKVKLLWDELGVGDLDTLRALAEAGRLAQLPGFGEKTQAKLLAEVSRVRAMGGRHPIARVYDVAQALRDRLAQHPDALRVEIAGSLRRGRETIGDIDFVCAAPSSAAIMADFVAWPEVEEILGHGETKSSVRLRGELQADLRVVPPEVFGATLHHFTGSKDHNIAMRRRAVERGLRISEYGVFRIGADGEEELVACETEEAIFAAVDLPWVAPELREDGGELAPESLARMASLVTRDAVRGDLHMHTTASDGRHTIDEMARAAIALGHDYICITDHSRSLTVANGLSAERLRAQIDAVAAWNEAHDGSFRVLAGLEVDILDDGELDMDDDVLARLDWVVGSVHQRMNQDADRMTTRLVNAIRTGRLSAIGHPTGRLIGQRDGFSFDFDAVLDACAEHGVALEVNASLERLDLSRAMIRRVVDDGRVFLTINTDAHGTDGLVRMDVGVRHARRGWAPRDRIVNTLAAAELVDRFGPARVRNV